MMAVSSSKRHTLALSREGDVFTWGHRGVTPRKVPLAGQASAAALDHVPPCCLLQCVFDIRTRRHPVAQTDALHGT